MADTPWPELYREYLRSQEWALKRAKVMRRAGGLCEGCGDHRATDVHHLSYEHVTQEFLFELVALCADCHERIHQQPGAAQRPRATTWTPKLATKPAATSQHRKDMDSHLAIKAAEARRKFMADRAEPPPPDGVPEAMEVGA